MWLQVIEHAHMRYSKYFTITEEKEGVGERESEKERERKRERSLCKRYTIGYGEKGSEITISVSRIRCYDQVYGEHVNRARK